MKPKKVFEISLKFQLTNTLPIHFHSFKTITNCPFYSPSTYHLPRPIIIFLLKKLACGNKYSQDFNWKLCPRKERAPNDPSLPFKEKEKGVEGKSKTWWPMEGERKTPFHLFPLSPQQILLRRSIFPFDLKVLLYHGSRPLLTHFLRFPWSINYNYAFQCNKSSTPSLSIWFWLRIWLFFLSLKLWRHTWSHLMNPKLHKRMKNRFQSRF